MLQGYPNIKFASAHLYTWVEGGTVRVKCLAQEHDTMYLDPSIDPEISALPTCMRSPHLQENPLNLITG